MDDNKNKLYKIITRCSILMLVLGYISYKCYFGFQNLINMMAIGEICNTNYGTKALLLLLFRFCFLIIPIIIILIFNLLIKNIVKYSNPITIKKINIVSNIYFICIIILIILFILSLIFGNKKQKYCWKKEDTTSNLNNIYLNNKM